MTYHTTGQPWTDRLYFCEGVPPYYRNDIILHVKYRYGSYTVCILNSYPDVWWNGDKVWNSIEDVVAYYSQFFTLELIHEDYHERTE